MYHTLQLSGPEVAYVGPEASIWESQDIWKVRPQVLLLSSKTWKGNLHALGMLLNKTSTKSINVRSCASVCVWFQILKILQCWQFSFLRRGMSIMGIKVTRQGCRACCSLYCTLVTTTRSAIFKWTAKRSQAMLWRAFGFVDLWSALWTSPDLGQAALVASGWVTPALPVLSLSDLRAGKVWILMCDTVRGLQTTNHQHMSCHVT